MLFAVPIGRIASGIERPAIRRAAAETVPSPPAATTRSVLVVRQFSERRLPVEDSNELVTGRFDELLNRGERGAVSGFLVVEE